jgi:hypothetical protein
MTLYLKNKLKELINVFFHSGLDLEYRALSLEHNETE